MRFTALINFMTLFLLVGSSGAQTGIQEEFLPQTTTIREIQTQIEMLENSLMEINLETGKEQIAQIRSKSLTFESGKNQSQEMGLILLKTDLLEMALNFYSNEIENAEKLALKVLAVDPSMTLSGEIATAELAMWFEDLRENHIGLVTILSRPSGASVWIDDRQFGVTPLENVFIPLGVHKIKIMLDGFTTWVGQVNVTRDQTQTVHSELRRNTGSLLVWAAPVNTRIDVDSHPIIKNTKPLNALLYPLAVFMGFSPRFLSQPVFIDALKPGEHTLKFQADCRKPIEFKISVSIGNFLIPPVVLKETKSFLTLESEQFKGDVYIDDSKAGTLPLKNNQICPGTYNVSVGFDNGSSWSKTIYLRDGDSKHFTPKPRPSILFLGCTSADPALSLEGSVAINRWFTESDEISLVSRYRTNQIRYRPAIASIMEKASRESIDLSRSEWNIEISNLTATLMDTQASVFAFAHLEKPKSGLPNQLVLLHADASSPDIINLPPGMPQDKIPGKLKKFLDHPLDFMRLKTGIRVTSFNDQIIITEIIPDGPAEMSPFQTNDIIKSVQDIPVSNRADFEQSLRTLTLDDLVTITVLRNEREIISSIQMIWQPTLLPLIDPELPYSLILARLKVKLMEPKQRTDHLVNAGICCLALGDPSQALDYFNQCHLKDEPGINNGTLAYLKYRAYSDLGQTLAADAELQAAKQSKNSTLIHGDGPLLADMVK